MNLLELIEAIKDYEYDLMDIIFNYVFVPCVTNKTNQKYVRALPYDGTNTIHNKQFQGDTNLKMIIIDDSVKIISDNAFKDCIFLKYVKFHNKLEIIQDYAFQHCSSLVNMYIPNNVHYLGILAFDGCSKLKKVVLPKKLIVLIMGFFTNVII